MVTRPKGRRACHKRDQHRDPKPVVAHDRYQHHHTHHINAKRDRHHIAHVAAAGRPHKYPVENECCAADHRQKHQIWQVYPRDLPDLRRYGHQIHNHPAEQPKYNAHPYGRCHSPAPNQRRDTAQHLRLACPRRFAHQRLGGKSEPVQRIARDHQELDQHLIGGQRYITLRSPHQHKAHKYCLKQERADQNIAVHPHHPPPARSIEHRTPCAPCNTGKHRATKP